MDSAPLAPGEPTPTGSASSSPVQDASSQSDAGALEADARAVDAPDWEAVARRVEELGAIVARERLSEIEVESRTWRLRVTATPAPSNDMVAGAGVAGALLSPEAGSAASSGPTSARGSVAGASEVSAPRAVVSPMVGVFYRAPSPSDPNFVEIGDTIIKGQTVALVEAMKVFNEIVAEESGVVTQLPVESGALVETGQPLILLK